MLKFVVIALVCAASLFGDTPPAIDAPKSRQAVDAEEKYQAAVLKARKAYNEAVVLAARERVDELDQAMETALGNKNVDEVKRIDAAKTKAQEALKKAYAPSELRDQLLSQQYFFYTWNGVLPARLLELLPDGRIGRGAAAGEERWAVSTSDGVERLEISGEKGTAELKQGENGLFSGKFPNGDVADLWPRL